MQASEKLQPERHLPAPQRAVDFWHAIAHLFERFSVDGLKIETNWCPLFI
jgi:hypothetical protein